MCQITVANTGNQEIDRKFFLVAGSIGSAEHSDGWGMVEFGKDILKSALQMSNTSNLGKLIKEYGKKKPYNPLLGHIRQASPKVPVCKENSHPFELDGIVFVHNGKLTPKKEKDFDTEYSIDVVDEKDPTKTYKKWISRSDSLIFFEEFVKEYKLPKYADKEPNKHFLDAFNKTMDKFTGKYAMVFIIDENYYVVRGRTADLYISYNTSTNKGWVINTSRDVLVSSINLLSDLADFNDEKFPVFSSPELLKQETAFLVNKEGLVEIGKVKEEYNYTTTYYTETGARNFTAGSTTQSGKSGTTISGTNDPLVKYAAEIYEFAESYNLTLWDLQRMFYIGYRTSLYEANMQIIKNFCENVIPRLRNLTNKPLRKHLKKVSGGLPISRTHYTQDFEFPWMVNSKQSQMELIKKLQNKS